MAPKTIATSGRRAPAQPGMIRSLYEELRSPENAPIVKSAAIFTVAVLFLQSSWNEFLVPAF